MHRGERDAGVRGIRDFIMVRRRRGIQARLRRVLRKPGFSRVPIAALVAAIALCTSAVAYAVWSGSGTGSGTATTGTTQKLTLSPGEVTPSLYPGGTADIAVTVSNPNPSPVRVTSFVLRTSEGTSGFAVDPGCSPGSLRFTERSGAWTIPPRVNGTDGTLQVVLPNSLSMLVNAPTGCQGTTATVYLGADG